MVAEEIWLDAKSQSSPGVSRRELLVTTAITLIFSPTSALALDVKGSLPWSPNAGSPPTPVHPGPWVYFTAEEGTAIEALVDRLIPPDQQTPGGKDAGCAVFIDRQLAGPYGTAERVGHGQNASHAARGHRRTSAARGTISARSRCP